jgi:hypothetical protein
MTINWDAIIMVISIVLILAVVAVGLIKFLFRGK